MKKKMKKIYDTVNEDVLSIILEVNNHKVPKAKVSNICKDEQINNSLMDYRYPLDSQ